MSMRYERDERGAVGLATALIVGLVLVGMAAFTVDLGIQRVARRDMQALADVVALDLARLLDGRTADQVRAGTNGHPSFSSALSTSLERNDGDTTGASCGDGSCVTGYLVDLDDDGGFASVDGVPVEVGGSTVPDGVVVVARTDVEFAFGLAESGSTSRQAVATASTNACFRLGSFAAALDTQASDLQGVFEALFSDAFGVQMTSVGYEGLLTSYVDLADIAAEMGVGSVEALVNQGSVSVASFLSATARALDADGQVEAAAVVGEVAAKVSGSLIMDVADILSVGNGSAARGTVNTLDLLGSAGMSAAAEVANQNNFLDTGVVWADPWLSKGDVKLTIIEAPQQGCGPIGTTARTAQVDLDVNLGLELTGEKINGLSLSTKDGSNKSIIHVTATLAGAQGTLSGLSCGAATDNDPEEFRVRVDSQLAAVNVEVPFHMAGEISTNGILSAAYLDRVLPLGNITNLSLVLDLDVTARIAASTPARTATDDTVYRVPPHDYTDPEPSSGAGDPISIPDVRAVDLTATATPKLKFKLLGVTTTINVPFADLDLSGLTNSILYGGNRVDVSLDNVTMNVNKALIPVSELLGVRTNGADVFGVPRPECGWPSLVG